MLWWLLLLLLLSRFSRVRLCVTPWTAAHQAPPSLGFSRQEHWSGLPFPSPMRESKVAQSCPTRSDPMDWSLPGSSVHGIFQARGLEWGAKVNRTVPVFKELLVYQGREKPPSSIKFYMGYIAILSPLFESFRKWYCFWRRTLLEKGRVTKVQDKVEHCAIFNKCLMLTSPQYSISGLCTMRHNRNGLC